MPNTARLMAMAGKMARWGAWIRNCRPVPPSMPPQVGVGGGGPKPRKERLASTMIVLPNWTEAKMMMGAVTLGRMCWNTIRVPVAPTARAASMY